MSEPLCPTCRQPASESLAGGPKGWECRNEACPEYGQPIRRDEPTEVQSVSGTDPGVEDPHA